MSGLSPVHQLPYDDVRPTSQEQDFFDASDDEKKTFTDMILAAECSQSSTSPSLTELTPLAYASDPTFDFAPYLGVTEEISWQAKYPMHWTRKDVAHWIQHVATSCKLNSYSFQAEMFNHCTGLDLMQMSEYDFQQCDPNWGAYIFREYQNLMNGTDFLPPTPESPTFPPPSSDDTKEGLVMDGNYYSFKRDDSLGDIIGDNGIIMDVLPSFPSLPVDRKPTVISEPLSPVSDSGSSSSTDVPQRRATRGAKGNHLWEFIRDLLLNSQTSPSLIRWEDRELGVFKIVRSEQVATLWGKKKNNSTMTYEKMSRAMRFCKKMQWFADAPKNGRFPKKLCYKFGPKSYGWESPRL